MATSIQKRARRDATLAVTDELAAVAQMERQAKREGKTAMRQTGETVDSEIKSLYMDQAREVYDLQAAATGANMGSAGIATAGTVDLHRKKSAAAAEIRSKGFSEVAKIRDQIAATLQEATFARKQIGAKRTLLIGQLSDSYRKEADQLAMQREQIAIERMKAQEQARANQASEAIERAKAGIDKDGKPKFDQQGYVAGIKKYVAETRMSARQSDIPFNPSEFWKVYANDPKLTDADKRDIWSALYPGGTPYPGDEPRLLQSHAAVAAMTRSAGAPMSRVRYGYDSLPSWNWGGTPILSPNPFGRR